jgi:hypothetical protein
MARILTATLPLPRFILGITSQWEGFALDAVAEARWNSTTYTRPTHPIKRVIDGVGK